MSNKRKYAFLINHGVEVRHFILSGLLQQVQATNDACILVRQEINSPALNEYISQYHVEAVRLPFSSNLKKRHRLEAYITAIRKARKRLKGLGNFHNFQKENRGISIRDRILSFPLFVHFAMYVGIKKLRQHYTQTDVVDFLQQQHITDLVLLEYNSPLLLLFGFSANHANMKVHVVMNTLKTFFVNDFIPFSLHRFYAWNMEQTKLFQQSNPHQNKENIVCGGNPYYAFFVNSMFDAEVENVQLKYPALHGKKWIVYSLIYEKMFANEYALLEILNNTITELFTKEQRPCLLIRRNPFEEKSELIEKLARLENVIIADHLWERDSEKEWSIQYIQGEKEWKLFLQQAALCMNIPSMAGYEAIISGTPVLNIGFDADGMPSVELEHFTKAPFMKDVNQSEFIQVCTTTDMLKKELPIWLNKKNEQRKEYIRSSLDFILFDCKDFLLH